MPWDLSDDPDPNAPPETAVPKEPAPAPSKSKKSKGAKKVEEATVSTAAMPIGPAARAADADVSGESPAVESAPEQPAAADGDTTVDVPPPGNAADTEIARVTAEARVDALVADLAAAVEALQTEQRNGEAAIAALRREHTIELQRLQDEYATAFAVRDAADAARHEAETVAAARATQIAQLQYDLLQLTRQHDAATNVLANGRIWQVVIVPEDQPQTRIFVLAVSEAAARATALTTQPGRVKQVLGDLGMPLVIALE